MDSHLVDYGNNQIMGWEQFVTGSFNVDLKQGGLSIFSCFFCQGKNKCSVNHCEVSVFCCSMVFSFEIQILGNLTY